MYKQTIIESERQRRIKVSIWAYAYECMGVSLVSDSTYDTISQLIDPHIKTGNDELD